jgi:hypothetical protein
MFPEMDAASYQGEGTLPVEPQEPGQLGEGYDAQQNVPITRAEFEERLRQAEEAGLRRAQNLFEKGNRGIERRVKEEAAKVEAAVEYLKSIGNPLTEAQIKAMRAEAVNKAMLPSSPAAQPGGSPQLPAPGETFEQPALDPVTQTGQGILRQANVPFDAPELRLIKQDGTPMEYYESCFRAAQAYQQRASGAQPQQQQQGGRPVGRTPTSAGMSGSGTNGSDLETKFQADLAKIRRGDTNSISALKLRYRKIAQQQGVKFDH